MSPISIPGKVTLGQSLGADPHYSSVSLLLHGDGTNGSTTIVDSSPSPKTVTAVGDAQISTTESKWNGSSLKFDGSGDYLTIPSSTDFAFGSGSFTIEGWIRLGSVPASGNVHYLIDTRTSDFNGFALYFSNIAGSARLNIFVSVPSPAEYSSTTNLVLNQWTHLACVRNGSSSFTFYVDGVASGSYSVTQAPGNIPLTIGSRFNGQQFFNGFIDDLRITKGIARYTSNFTPPAQPFLAVAP